MNGINTCTKKNSSTGKTMRTQVFWHRQKKIPGLLTVNLMKFKFELLKRTSDTQCSILLSIAPARSLPSTTASFVTRAQRSSSDVVTQCFSMLRDQRSGFTLTEFLLVKNCCTAKLNFFFIKVSILLEDWFYVFKQKNCPCPLKSGEYRLMAGCG